MRILVSSLTIDKKDGWYEVFFMGDRGYRDRVRFEDTITGMEAMSRFIKDYFDDLGERMEEMDD